MAQEPMLLCPTCRTAILDRDYYRHAKACQAQAKALASAKEE